MSVSYSDLSLYRTATGFCFYPDRRRRIPEHRRVPHFLLPPVRPTSLYDIASEKRKKNDWKPSICTADELHYVSVPNSDWTLALWRYLPSHKARPRNHPLLLLSGVGTNAIGYDLSPESSFARYMSGQGFDTWILEVRGAGLSMRGMDFGEIKQPLNAMRDSSVKHGLDVLPSERHSTHDSGAFADSDITFVNGKSKRTVSKSNDVNLVTKFRETFLRLSEKLSDFLNEGQNSGVASQFRDLSQWLANVIEESQVPVPTQFLDFQERFSTTLDELQMQLDLIGNYDWDFDHYLEEDVPAVMEYIKNHCEPKDGKLLAIGHSMGGILLYAMLSRCCSEGRNSGLASVATLASSLDYTSSKSSLKLLLPLADPAEALKVPVIPIGGLLSAAHPLASRPPYVLSWLNPQISAQDMMHPKLFEKLVLNNFCTVPAKVLLQLTTAFQKGGLRDRSGTFFYKDHLHKTNVPILALAGDQDLICPPEAVYETVKMISEDLVAYKVFGEPGGPHYAHYDLVGGRLVADQVYPCIIEFLSRHDTI
ncbi:uncharacterized protein LOC121242643 isoform X2 [Juglans microcarpa x Juglans regia]|uniref:uncharacterized protein LOC121242643 isoform X2 n=1 Tax=Juglans microcarpa x Juglans regia TaxID=2249226 RepID=UPI001B7E8B4B|nr:uncharacterized protein LOC121242643 isoform X2 [Juglans microcarpa x Juglans regia]